MRAVVMMAAALTAVAGLAVGRAAIVPGYAIVGARVVPVSGPPIERGTVVVRGGVIAEAGEGVEPPADVQRIDGAGLTVYPGLVDLHSSAGLDQPQPAAPQNPDTREVSERFRRQQLLRAQVQAADLLKPDAPALAALTAQGITNAVVVPRGDAIAGYSALIDAAAPELDPQVGRLAVDPRGPMILRPAVALHVAFPGRGFLGAYPASLMGGIAFVRQAFLDARHYQQTSALPEGAAGREPYDRALAAMGPALGGAAPVALAASTATEIRRALAFAKEMGLTPIVTGAHGAADVAAELKAAGARVVLSLDYPTRAKTLAPDADEPHETLAFRAAARRAAAALAAAGVPFGFGSADLKDPKDFLPNVRVAIERGLSPEAALRALTLDAAALAGAGARLGSIERGKRANLVVTDGDLFGEKTKVKHVFVAGRLVPIAEPESRASR
jgi:imidazolonepropionase-like amidohydrolase